LTFICQVDFLLFGVEPTNTVVNTPITPAVVVEIRDAQGALLPGTGPITLSIDDDPSGGTATLNCAACVNGVSTAPNVGGTATFSDLSIDVVGNGYSFAAQGEALDPAISIFINITP